MKKLLSILLMVCIFASGICVHAETIDVEVNSVNLQVNGQQIQTPNILWNGTTYVPLRAVSETLGCTVGWDDASYTASIENSLPSMLKLQTQLSVIKSDLWAASQIESEAYDYFESVIYNPKGTYVSGQDIITKYKLAEHDNYFINVGAGKQSTENYAYILDPELRTLCENIGYDPNNYYFILWQSHMYCESMTKALHAMDSAITTGASMYITQAQGYLDDANNYWNSANDANNQLIMYLYELIAF